MPARWSAATGNGTGIAASFTVGCTGPVCCQVAVAFIAQHLDEDMVDDVTDHILSSNFSEALFPALGLEAQVRLPRRSRFWQVIPILIICMCKGGLLALNDLMRSLPSHA